MGPPYVINPSIFSTRKIKYYCRCIFVYRTILYYFDLELKFVPRRVCLYTNELHNFFLNYVYETKQSDTLAWCLVSLLRIWLGAWLGKYRRPSCTIIVYIARYWHSYNTKLRNEITANFAHIEILWNISVDWSNMKCLIHHITFYRPCFYYNCPIIVYIIYNIYNI